MSDDECTTWRQLRDRIDAMPEERLDDPIQLIPHPHDDEPIELHQVIGLDTIGHYCDCGDGTQELTRGIIDNEHHPEHWVLLTDMGPFDEDGNTCYLETEEGLIGNKTGKNYGPGIFSKDE